MRGFTHFISGMAVATFFPELVSDLLQGNLLPVLAGASAYLPDFLDFKIKRIIEKWDVEIDPAPPDEKALVSPKTIDLSSIDPVKDRYRWYAFNVTINKVIEKGVGKLEGYGEVRKVVLEATDSKGNVTKVYIINEDIDLFKTVYNVKEFEELVGRNIRLTGYVDLLDGGRASIVFSDAPHPGYIAEKVAKAIDEAWEKGEVRVKFHNIRLPGDVFRRYSVMIPSDSNYVEVFVGAVVTLGDNPVIKTPPPKHRSYARAYFKPKVRKTYPFPVSVGGFSGPSVAYRRVGDSIEEVFIPWHRGFSHSMTAGLLVGGVVAGLFTLLGYANAIQLGLACLLGQWMHVLEDQMGYMGSVLLPPFTKRRVPGLMLGRASSGWLNTALTYTMFVLMAWNFSRFVPGISRSIGLKDPNLILYVGLIPAVIAFAIGIVKGVKERRVHMEIMRRYRELGVFEELEEELVEF